MSKCNCSEYEKYYPIAVRNAFREGAYIAMREIKEGRYDTTIGEMWEKSVMKNSGPFNQE